MTSKAPSKGSNTNSRGSLKINRPTSIHTGSLVRGTVLHVRSPLPSRHCHDEDRRRKRRRSNTRNNLTLSLYIRRRYRSRHRGGTRQCDRSTRMSKIPIYLPRFHVARRFGMIFRATRLVNSGNFHLKGTRMSNLRRKSSVRSRRASSNKDCRSRPPRAPVPTRL